MNKINVCFVTDENYAPYMGTAIYSIVCNAKHNRRFVFYVFDSGIQEKTKETIKKIAGRNEVNFIDSSVFSQKLASLPQTSAHITKSSYLKFIISDVLKDLNKVLYLDCDLIVTRDIKELYDADIENNLIGAVEDVGYTYWSKHNNDLKLKFKCMNSGVMLINCDLWRKENLSAALIECASDHDKVGFGQDQPVLNFVCKNRVCFLPFKWNVQDTFFRDSAEIQDRADIEECHEARDNPAIIHYTFVRKPWNDFDVVKVSEFWKYHKYNPLCNMNNIPSCAGKTHLPSFLVRLLSHITFGKTKARYKVKWTVKKNKLRNLNRLGRLCAEEKRINELTKLCPVNQEKLNIGKCMALSALLDGKLRLSPAEKGKIIIRSFVVEVTNNPYVGYETSDGFIYFVALPYSCYWGYFDNNYVFHPLDDPDMMFGIPLYPQEVLKEILLLKQKERSIPFFKRFYKKRIMLLATWNLGHHIWQEQPGIDFLRENNLLKRIQYMYFFTDYFNMSSYLEKFGIKSKFRKKHNFTTRHIVVYFTEDVFFEKNAKRLLDFCNKKSDIRLPATNINVVISLRWNQRVWREENAGVAEIINALTEKYEKISFYIDGFSKPACEGDGFNCAEKIQRDKENTLHLAENLSSKALENIHSIIGKNCIEKVKIYSEASLLVMPFGTPEHYNWMSRTPVILYGPKAARDLSIILNSSVVIPDLKIDSYLIPESCIFNEEGGNYSMDWHVLFDAIDKKIREILIQRTFDF